MPAKMKATISRSAKGVSVRISGTPRSLSADRIRGALEHHLACNVTNRCREEDQTVLERVRCVAARARRRTEGVALRLSTQSGLKVSVQEAEDGFEISLGGAGAARLAKTYTNAELTERLNIAVGCARTNRCDLVSQSLKDQLNCVGVGAKRRLALR